MPGIPRPTPALLSSLLVLLAACESREPPPPVTIYDAGPRVDAGPGCTGTPTPCGALDTPTCELVPGCASGSCGGTPPDCSSFVRRPDCQDAGCDWDSAMGCAGLAAACDTWSSRADCEGAECRWAVSACSGAPTECALLDPSGCRATPGCNLRGDAPSDAGPGAIDAGPGMPRDWPSMCPFAVCDLRTSEGCPSDQKCLLLDGQILCSTVGFGRDGDSCVSSYDCERGYSCLDLGVRTCRRICCGTASGQCPSSSVCRGISDVENLGACFPECDPVRQDCDPGSACYLSGETAVCNVPGAGRLGAACVIQDDCSPGLGCVNFGSGGSQCVQLCRRSSPSCPSGLRCEGLSGTSTYGFCG